MPPESGPTASSKMRVNFSLPDLNFQNLLIYQAFFWSRFCVMKRVTDLESCVTINVKQGDGMENVSLFHKRKRMKKILSSYNRNLISTSLTGFTFPKATRLMRILWQISLGAGCPDRRKRWQDYHVQMPSPLPVRSATHFSSPARLTPIRFGVR